MNKLTRTFTVILIGVNGVCACLAAPGDATPLSGAVVRSQIAADADANELKIAALGALMAAPAERAMPLLTKVLDGRYDDEVKAKALFVLSQVDAPEADALLVKIARDPSSSVRHEAIRMIGIGGSAQALGALAQLYNDGDEQTRDQVLQAYLIANDADAVFAIAAAAKNDHDFDRAARTLGAMGAREQLRKLRDVNGGSYEGLIQAYAIAGDVDSLSALANDADDPEARMAALRGLGIIHTPQANALLRRIYSESADPQTREAALNGLLIGGDDDGVLALFRASNDPQEKRRLLRQLVIMGSDEMLDVIDTTLEEGQ